MPAGCPNLGYENALADWSSSIRVSGGGGGVRSQLGLGQVGPGEDRSTLGSVRELGRESRRREQCNAIVSERSFLSACLVLVRGGVAICDLLHSPHASFPFYFRVLLVFVSLQIVLCAVRCTSWTSFGFPSFLRQFLPVFLRRLKGLVLFTALCQGWFLLQWWCHSALC